MDPQRGLRILNIGHLEIYGVSKNSGTPKWMVYNKNPY